jgi:hypothetical protein
VEAAKPATLGEKTMKYQIAYLSIVLAILVVVIS